MQNLQVDGMIVEFLQIMLFVRFLVVLLKCQLILAILPIWVLDLLLFMKEQEKFNVLEILSDLEV